jgi:hypothetical protein
MEYICLSNRFELASNQRTSILHNVVRSDSMDRQPVSLRGLQATSISLFLFRRPRRVRNVPDIFDNAEQYCMEKLNRCILCRVKA